MDEIRRKMLNGEYVSDCESCYAKERAGIFSDRQKYTKNFRAPSQPDERYMNLKITLWGNFCNLQCAMCHPVHSSARTTELKTIQKDTPELDVSDFQFKNEKSKITSVRYHDLVKNILEHIHIVKALEISSDGEPLLNSRMYDFLLSIPDEHAKEISLSITTNLSERSFRHYHLDQIIEKFPSTHLRVSSEHIEEKYEWIRYPASFDKLVDNLKHYKDHVFKVAPAVSVLNIGDLYEIKLFYNTLGVGCLEPGTYSVVRGPILLRTKLHSQSKRLLELYRSAGWADDIVYEMERDDSEWFTYDKERSRMELYLDRLSKERGNWREILGDL
jgi:MoaA/NifB/PqqE/SkfB family radical SAM enzyme